MSLLSGRAIRRTAWAITLGAVAIWAQDPPPPPRPGPPPPPPPVNFVDPAKPARRADAPGADEVLIGSIHKEVQGAQYYLRGASTVETTDMLLKGDEIDYNEDTGAVEARGNVYYENLQTGEKLWAKKVEYNMKDETGKFYEVRGSSPAKVSWRPGLLMTNNPYLFEGVWAEKLKNRYILHDGFITNCKLPRPMWKLTAPKFDIIPNDRALAYNSFFKVQRIPLFYTPMFYKSLEEQPRKSGFLTPSFGHSSIRGWMYAIGYYWAINRSYDVMYRPIYYSARGLAHQVDFRGKPRAGTEVTFSLFGIKDRGVEQENGTLLQQSGYLFNVTAKSDLGDGWKAAVNINYLSSFNFRQSFTQNYNEAIYSEVNSTAYIGKTFGSYSFYGVFARHQLFQSADQNDQIVIRKLPSFELFGRETQIRDGKIPLWLSLEASASYFKRRQPLFETRSYMGRMDASPRLSSTFNYKGFTLAPSFTYHGTYYNSRQSFDGLNIQVLGQDLARNATDVQVELITPTLERIFDGPKWLGGKFKHVVEARGLYRRVDGVNNFLDTIRLDEVDLLNDTSEAQISLINRLYTKRGNDVLELLTWELRQARYFDPSFGGALLPGRRNVFASSLSLTGYAFFDRLRNYSPVVSSLRFRPVAPASVEWRLDYDPLFKRVVNSTVNGDLRFKHSYYVGAGHTRVRAAPGVSGDSNQLQMRGGRGEMGRRGWNVGFNGVYDFQVNRMLYSSTEVSYNTDCCGYSVQYRKLNYNAAQGPDNLFFVSFSVANIGSFGSLRRQERQF